METDDYCVMSVWPAEPSDGTASGPTCPLLSVSLFNSSRR